MTEPLKTTLKKIGGIFGLILFVLVMVFVLTPQLAQTAVREILLYIVMAIGTLYVLVQAIKLLVSNNHNGRRGK